jgi:hypothetical protein
MNQSSTLLSCVNLSDRFERDMLADACLDDGYGLDAALLRSALPVYIRDGEVMPDLEVAQSGSNGDEDTVEWVNCRLGTVPFAGCWVRNSSRGQECEAYQGTDMTGGSVPDAEFFRIAFRLDLTEDEAEDLVTRAQDDSVLTCEVFLAEQRKAEKLARVEAAYNEASGEWTGCSWTAPHECGDAVVDADGLDGTEDAEELASQFRDGDEFRYEWNMAAQKAIKYAAECTAAAAEAEERAAEALLAAQNGDWDRALDLANEAVSLESEYGDCPAWGPFRNRIEQN